MEKQYIGAATPEQIAEWKAKYSDVRSIKVDGHICYVKPPSRKGLAYATTAGAKDMIKFNEVLLNECFIGGSELIKTSDPLFLGVSAKLAELIEVKEAEMEKL